METTCPPEPYGEKGGPTLFERTKKRTSCQRYRVLLEEDSARGGGARLKAGAKLSAHAWGCVVCSKALDDALLAVDLMGHARESIEVCSDVFMMSVMAGIREERMRQTAPSAIWRPLELLALRFALVAATVALALSLYLAGLAPPSYLSTISSEAEVRAGFAEPPGQLSNQDKVLVSLARSGPEF